ncbi:MAG: arylesterase [Gemmatimonadota bacterium]
MRFFLLLIVFSAAACRGEAGSNAAEDTVRTGPVPDSVTSQTGVPLNPLESPRPLGGDADGRSNVLIIGTSLTAGYGLDNPDDSYPAVMQRIADSAGFSIRVTNAGLSGETSAGALRRLEWVLREPVDFVIVETGANDGLRGLDVDTTRANLRTIVRRIRAAHPSAKVALVQMEAPPNLGPIYTSRFRESFRLVAEEEGVLLFPFLLDGVAGVATMNQGDGIHPNEEGSRRVAANVWRALVRAL